jgi:large subunit ribosomal protein L9
MEIILLERVEKLGKIGDVVRVKDGYARNFLLPQKKALRANDNNRKLFEAQKAELVAKNQELKVEAEQRATKIDGISVTIIRQASEDGRLFGSVSARDIAKMIAEKDESVTHQNVRLTTAIKTIGIYPTKVQLHPEVTIIVKVNVARSESEALEALQGGKAKTAKAKEAEEIEAEAAAGETPEEEAAA